MAQQSPIQPGLLERYAFLWSLARLVIAAFSLFFGAMPIVYNLGMSGFSSLLMLFWLISGVAALYLGYLWYKGGMKVFGKDDTKTKVLFLILVLSGLNLGWASIGGNIGMSIVGYGAFSGIIYKLTALVYLYVAYILWQEWKTHGEELFSASLVTHSHSEAASVREMETSTGQKAEEKSEKGTEERDKEEEKPKQEEAIPVGPASTSHNITTSESTSEEKKEL